MIGIHVQIVVSVLTVVVLLVAAYALGYQHGGENEALRARHREVTR